jgi:DNA-binding transcriptional LysR family regulator
LHNANWDDLRYVLAVAETGSLSAAARALGVNHATILRHVQTFEEAHGGPVFSRTPHGYAVLPERARVIDAARDASAAVDSAARLMRGARAPMRGTVRISATDTLCTTLLPGIAARIMAGAEGLRIEIRNTNAHEDFARMQADVAIRPGKALSEDMSGQIAAQMGFGLYRASAGIDRWLGLTGHLARAAPAEWMAAHVPAERIVAGADSFVTLRDMAAAGAGQVILPCLLGDAHPGVQRVHGVFPDMAVPLWVASHADLARSPRIRLVTTRLLKHLGENAAALAGTA